MSDEEDFRELCNRYLKSLDADVDEERRRSLQTRISELEEEREDFLQDYGEDDVLVHRLDEQIESLRSEFKNIQDVISQSEELEETILQRTSSEYIAEGEYLSDEVLEALNHICTGSRKPQLLIKDWVVGEDEFEEDVLDVSDYTRKIAMAKLGSNDSIRESWKNIAGGKKLSAFVTVARSEEPLSPAQVAERMEENVDSNTAGTRLRNAIHGTEYTPYHRIDGDYTLSTVGQFMFREYADQDKLESVENEGEAEGEQQATLEATPEGQ